MTKLKELFIKDTDEFANFTPFDTFAKTSLFIHGPDKKIIGIEPKYKVDNYKGYRFIDYTYAGYLHYFYMLLPDRYFLIGKLISSTNLENHPCVTISAIHKRFRRKGLGRTLYAYIIDKYGVIESDTELHSGSVRVWVEKLPQIFPNGQLCIKYFSEAFKPRYTPVTERTVSNTLLKQIKDVSEISNGYTSFTFFKEKPKLVRGILVDD